MKCKLISVQILKAFLFLPSLAHLVWILHRQCKLVNSIEGWIQYEKISNSSRIIYLMIVLMNTNRIVQMLIIWIMMMMLISCNNLILLLSIISSRILSILSNCKLGLAVIKHGNNLPRYAKVEGNQVAILRIWNLKKQSLVTLRRRL